MSGEGTAATLNPKIVPPGEGTRLQILAETGCIKLRGEDTAGAYTVMEGRRPRGAGPPVHKHSREDETFYVLERTYEFTVGGKPIAAPRGTTVLGPKGIPHTFRNIGTTEARMLIFAQPAGIERFFEEMTQKLAAGAPDLVRLGALAERYGLEFTG
jgi:quercetin dioxygenase-like cupin family protein